MKIRAWQIMVIKKMLREYDKTPSKDFFKKCLEEIAIKSNKPQATIAIITCSNPNCGKVFERPYSEVESERRKNFTSKRPKLFCSRECTKTYTYPILKKTYVNEIKNYESGRRLKNLR